MNLLHSVTTLILLCAAKYYSFITHETSCRFKPGLASPYSYTKEVIFLAQHDIPLSSAIDNNVSTYDHIVEFVVSKIFHDYSFSHSLWEFSVLEVLLYLILILIVRDGSSWVLPIIGLASHSVRYWSDSDVFLNINSHPLSLLFLNFLILLVFDLAMKRRFTMKRLFKFPVVLIFCCLLYCRIEFIYLVPFIIALSKGANYSGDSAIWRPKKDSSWSNLTVLVIAIIATLLVSVVSSVFLRTPNHMVDEESQKFCRLQSSNSSNNNNSSLSYRCLFQQIFYRHFPQSFSPNIGIYWYLDAEIIDDFFIYFELLRLFQPLILSIPLYMRVGHYMPAHGFAIMVFLIQFYRKDTNLIDFFFAFYTLYRLDLLECDENKKMFNFIRFKGWLLLGLTYPVILSPLMLTLWTEFGSGNANWLFFQGLGLYGFLAFAIIEVCRSTVIICDKVSGEAIWADEKPKSST